MITTTTTPWQQLEGGFLERYRPLEKDAGADVAVIGAGITGLTAALTLQRGGLKTILLEAHQVGGGETGHTTAHLTQVLDTRYYRLIETFGEPAALSVARAKRRAIEWMERTASSLSIPCWFERLPGFLYSESQDHDLGRELEAMRKLDVAVTAVGQAPLPFPTRECLRIEDQAQVHPVEYVRGLAAEFVRLGGGLHEGTRVVSVQEGEPCEVTTDRARVKARDVVIAANVPVTNRLFLNTKIAAYRSYALGLRLGAVAAGNGLFWDTAEPYHYIRSALHPKEGPILIVGGQDHKTGTREDTEGGFRELEAYARSRFDVRSVSFRWSGQIIEPLDGLPYIGQNSLSRRVYVATGFSGNGMTFGTLAGLIVGGQILGTPVEEAVIFDATRLHPTASLRRFVTENKDFPAYFLKDRLTAAADLDGESLQAGGGRILSMNGRKVAAYRDSGGELHCLSPVCPHLGCHVHWNSAESSWDCPCHGSRFDGKGRVVNGPALADLRSIELGAPGMDEAIA